MEDFYDLLTSDPGIKVLRIGLIIIGTFMAVRMTRRWLPHTVERVIEEREEDQANYDEVRGSPEHYRLRELNRERARQRGTTLAMVGVSVISALLWTLGFLLVLSELRVNLAPLIAGAGIVGIAVGFGAQEMIRDFLSGFFVILEDQYAVGDIVDLGHATGTVEMITMRFTRLRDLEGKVWFIPNGEVRRVGNLSKLWSRAIIDVGIAYEADIDRASEAMVAAANDVRDADIEEATIIDEPTVLGVEDFGASSVVVRMLLRTEPGEQWTVARAVRARIKARFDADGIEIPFSQHVVRMHTEGPNLKPSLDAGGDVQPDQRQD